MVRKKTAGDAGTSGAQERATDSSAQHATGKARGSKGRAPIDRPSPTGGNPQSKKPLRIAIVGGGCAGLAAAWELSRSSSYDVHVFEQNFRLGGKGASGRDEYGRIHEHGLHVWLGFYENAFRMMRECYAEVAANDWGPHRAKAGDRLAHASIDDAFFPEPHVGVGGVDSHNIFNVWSGMLPPAKGLPGEPLDAESNPYSLASYLLRCLDLIKTLIQSTVASPSGGWTPADETNQPANAEELVAVISHYLYSGALTSIAAILHAVTLIEQWVRHVDDSRKRTSQVVKVLVAVAAQLRKALSDVVDIDEKLRWKTEMVDIVLAIAVGLVRDRVLFRRQGFDAINDLDYRAWLAKHGATRAALDSRFIAGIYELVFAFEDGDHRRPAFAAGVALRSALRMFFTYRGSMFWRMRSGMGDAVFAPLYKTMLAPSGVPGKASGRSAVRFYFMHRLRRVELDCDDDDRLFVTGLEFETSGDPERTSATTPEAVDHFGCWPMDDRLLRAAPGAPNGRRSLCIGADFDAVIFAMGVDDVVSVLRGPKGDLGLFEKLPERWRDMAANAHTAATQAAQIWLDADFKSLGWSTGSGITTALGLSFDTWADMTHTLATERAWRRAKGAEFAPLVETARAVGYFCSVLPDRAIAENDGDGASVVAREFWKLLSSDARAIWPLAFDDQLTAVDRVVDPSGFLVKEGLRRYVRANAVGSERYTLSTPGSIAYRISPLDQSVANMTIAGDWTACGLDAGCVEAAVMSGKLAAHAITGSTPPLASIIGYDHP